MKSFGQLTMCGVVTALISVLSAVDPANSQTTATKSNTATKPGAEKPAADNDDISPKTVKLLMGEAMSLIPSETKKADGTVIKFDKNDPSKILIPHEDAVRVIKVAYMSAQASRCGLPEVETENWHLLRSTEIAKKQWSDQQLFYISRLHVLVVMTLVGNYKLREGESTDDQKKAAIVEGKKAAVQQTCTDTEKKAIISRIEAYWNGPKKS